MSKPCDFGLIGLAVMGENLALNVESRGFRVAVFNRTTEKVDEFIQERAAGKNFVGRHSVEELVRNLARPRKVMMLVKVGPAGDGLFCRWGRIGFELVGRKSSDVAQSVA